MHSDKKGWILLSRSLCNWQLRANLKLCIGCVRQSVALSRSMLGWKIKGPGIKSALFSGAAKGRRAVNIDWRIYGRWMPVLRSVEGKYDQSKANTTPLRQLRLAPSWAGRKRQKLKALGNGILCGAICIINVFESENISIIYLFICLVQTKFMVNWFLGDTAIGNFPGSRGQRQREG